MGDFILKNKNYLIIIITCLLLLMPIIVVGSYDRPIADDYDYGILTHDAIQKGGNLIDLISAAIQMDLRALNGWQGLYSSAFILSLHPGIFGESFYGLTCIIVLSVAFLFLYFSMRILNKHYIKESNIFIFMYTLIFLTIIALILPSATQGLYWFNGSMNYMPWAFSNFLGICLLIELFYTEYGSRKYFLLLGFSTLLSFLTSGGSHVTGFANILFMLILTVFLIMKKKRYYSILPLLLAIMGFSIMLNTPGTALRQSILHQRMAYIPSVSDTIINTIIHVVDTLLSWLNFKWLLSLIIITPISLLISQNIKNRMNTMILIESIICSLVIISGMFAVPYYAMGGFGEPRLTNVIWITFIILSWINYTLLISILEKNNIINLDLNNKSYEKWVIGIIIISLFLIFCLPQGDVNSNSYLCLQELQNGNAEQFAMEMDNRVNLIKSSNQQEIKVNSITPGSILYFSDIGNDPTSWPNTSMEDYYHKRSIYI